MLNIVGVITPEYLSRLLWAIAICASLILCTWILKKKIK
jgi:hypothetical protein